MTGLRAGTGGSGTQNNGTASSSASTVLDDSLAELTQQTQDLIASADNLLAGLTDIAGQAGAAETDINQGAEGSLPEQSVSIDSIISGSSSSSAASSEPASSSEGGSESVDSSSSESTSDPGTDSSAPSSESSSDSGSSGSSAPTTINVTMNGTAQTMDCLLYTSRCV